MNLDYLILGASEDTDLVNDMERVEGEQKSNGNESDICIDQDHHMTQNMDLRTCEDLKDRNLSNIESQPFDNVV